LFDHGADALADAHLIGVDAHVRDVLEAVHVMVDEPRSHQAPGRVEDPGAGGDGNLRRQSGDAVVADGHVENGVHAVGRIDDPPPLDDEVVVAAFVAHSCDRGGSSVTSVRTSTPYRLASRATAILRASADC